MKKIIFIALICFTTINLFSQSRYQELVPRKNIYVELGGNGIAFNIVAETRLKPCSDGLGVKVGAGGFSSPYEKIFTIPVQANWLFTNDNKNFFETGLGFTYLNYESKDYWGWSGYQPYPVDVIGMTIEHKNSVYGSVTLGYRKQPAKGGITWGAALTPHFNKNGFWPIWFGFKFGYSIAKKK